MMSDLSLCIGFVMHKARIKVDESGTEAAAVTDAAMEFTSAGPGFEPKIIEFHADYPSLYAVTESSTGTIYFLGEYTGK